MVFNGVAGLAEKSESITVKSVTVGALQVRNLDFVVLPNERPAIAGQPINGILGANFWSSFVVHLDFTRRRITFVIPANRSISFVKLSQNPVYLSQSEIKQEGFGKAITVPLLMFLGQAFAGASLRSGPTSVADFFLIDSGSDASFLSKATQQKLNLKIISKGFFTGIEGQSTAVDVWLPRLTSGDLKLNDLLVHTATMPNLPQSRSILGLDILANYDVLFDFPHQKMYLKPRSDLQAVTSQQYEAASLIQRQQWAQRKLIIRYSGADGSLGLPISYDLNPDGLPLAQVRPDNTTPPSPFLLKSNTHNVFASSALAAQWHLDAQPALDEAGKPQLLLKTEPFSEAKAANLSIGSISVNGSLVVLPADGLLSWASYESVPGIIGATVIFAKPILMDPATQTWTQLTGLYAEDLPTLRMADAAAVDILDPDKDGIPAVAVQVQLGTAQATDTLTLATGSPFTLLSAEAAKALKLTPEPQKLSYGVGKDITVFNQAHLSQLSIGGVVIKDVAVAYPIGAMPSDFYPRLGMNVISKLRLLVDVPGKKMYVKAGQ